MGERESCNSRHFSRLMKSCFPNPNPNDPSHPPSFIPPIPISTTTTTTAKVTPKHRKSHPTTSSSISSLPDDLLLEILSRAPLSSLPSLSSVSRRWAHLLHSPSFSLLHHPLHPTLFAFSLSSSSSSSISTLRPLLESSWNNLPQDDAVSLSLSHIDLSHTRMTSIGRKIYLIGRSNSAVFDPWTASVRLRSGLLFQRKRFAAAAVSGRIYVAGGSSRASAVEEYDPESDEWRVVSDAPRRRYGCFGVGVDGVFYVIGGLKIGASDSRSVAGAEARVYASSMDLYDVAARGWLRSRAVPGGGCVVAACGANGYVYVLASHAVELSFWRFNAKRKSYNGSGNSSCGSGNSNNGSGNGNFGSGSSNCGNGGGGGYGEWSRMRSPPVAAQVRVDGTVRFSCVGVKDKVVLIQVMGSIDDLLRRSGRNVRGCKDGLVLIFDCVTEVWSRGPDLPELLQRSVCVSVEC